MNESKFGELAKFLYPSSTISRIVKLSMGSNCRISRDALDMINRCSILFSIYIASMAVSESQNNKRAIVNCIFVNKVLETSGFHSGDILTLQ
ncbi:hypothetical protein ACR3K2_06520 [Cryptosporidium serpentis]